MLYALRARAYVRVRTASTTRMTSLCLLAAIEVLSGVTAANSQRKCYWSNSPGSWCGPYCESCGPGHETCGPMFGAGSPQFHIMDSSCGTQDPNAPIYDPRHGVYHMFWQAHTARPCAGDFRAAPSIGHAVSRDVSCSTSHTLKLPAQSLTV